MSEHTAGVDNLVQVPFVIVALASLAYVFATVLTTIAAAQQPAAMPDFSMDNASAWLTVGDELLPPPSGPGPVTFDKRYPYVDNGRARRTGTQPTIGWRTSAIRSLSPGPSSK
jgi:hypothetical protein